MVSCRVSPSTSHLYLYGVFKETNLDGQRAVYAGMMHRLVDNEDGDDHDGRRKEVEVGGGQQQGSLSRALLLVNQGTGSKEEEEVVMALRALVPSGMQVFWMRAYDQVGRAASRKNNKEGEEEEGGGRPR